MNNVNKPEMQIKAEQSFRNAICSIVAIPDEELQKTLAISKLKNIAKGECFIREGEIPRHLGFVVKGLFRYYYLDLKGNEFTKAFMFENLFITSYSALIQNRESYYTIEALEDSLIVSINYHEWKKLIEDNIYWYRMFLFFIERAYCIKEAREREFLLFDAEARYISFLETYPGLEKRIKQHLIASYLGITPVALSRIRKKMGIINTG